MALGQIINEIKGEIKAEVRLHGPPTLEAPMELALEIEENL